MIFDDLLAEFAPYFYIGRETNKINMCPILIFKSKIDLSKNLLYYEVSHINDFFIGKLDILPRDILKKVFLFISEKYVSLVEPTYTLESIRAVKGAAPECSKWDV